MLVRIQPREPQSVAQSGSVLRLERKSRGFESHLTDHLFVWLLRLNSLRMSGSEPEDARFKSCSSEWAKHWGLVYWFVPGTLNPMNLVRIQNPQPFLSLSVSLNTTECRDKVPYIFYESMWLRLVVCEIGSVAWLDCWSPSSYIRKRERLWSFKKISSNSNRSHKWPSATARMKK